MANDDAMAFHLQIRGDLFHRQALESIVHGGVTLSPLMRRQLARADTLIALRALAQEYFDFILAVLGFSGRS